MNNTELLFHQYNLSDTLKNQEDKAVQAIDAYNADKLLNTSTYDLIEYFVKEYQVEIITIHEDQIIVDQKEAKIDVSQEGSRHIVDRSRPFYIDGTRVTFYLPYEGDKNLFYCQPSTFDYNPPRVVITQTEIQFIYDCVNHKAETVKSEFDSDLGKMKRYLGWVEKDVNSFNIELIKKISQHIEWRKDKILKDRGLVSALGFPMKKRGDSSETYIAPISRKQIRTPPPTTSTSFMPEPVLDIQEYDQILSIISSMVQVMERSPNAFRDMKEEDLRQQFLVQLNGHYEGQATGETFNYQGKTDILIRENNKNLFIAECKFWKGEKVLLETISQLLGYTSWRDTKTAILIFNRNKNFTEVVKIIPEIVKKHPNFKRQLPYDSETNSRYILNHVGDPNRELILTLMAFDVPGNE